MSGGSVTTELTDETETFTKRHYNGLPFAKRIIFRRTPPRVSCRAITYVSTTQITTQGDNLHWNAILSKMFKACIRIEIIVNTHYSYEKKKKSYRTSTTASRLRVQTSVTTTHYVVYSIRSTRSVSFHFDLIARD